MNYRMIKHILGWILIFEALFMVVPLITGIIFREKATAAFIISIIICLAAGGLCLIKKPQKNTLYSREGFVIVSLSWIVLSLFGAVPFVISGSIPGYIDALFETVSGFTTTGASILSEVESLPKCILIWRSFTHWVGGMGVLVFIMAFLPLSGAQNMHLMKAESPGPSVSKLVPRVRTTAMILYSIYLILTAAEFIILLAGGMSVFDALNTAVATAGTGGFCIKNDSIGGYSSFVQIVVTVFMILFAINFNSYYMLAQRKLKEVFNLEVRTFLIVLASVSAVITVNVYSRFPSIGEAVKHVLFTTSSVMSSTGFSTVDYNEWPELSRTLITLLMFIGACAGSTGGGIKVSRIIILCKSMGKELETLVHPHQVKKITMDSRPVGHDVVRSVNVYMVCYILVYVVSLIILSFNETDLITNFTAVASAINNIGPGLERVGPAGNFGFYSDISKLVIIFDMLAGRLELYPILMLLAPVTWKKR